MPQFTALPQEVFAVFGPIASEKFVDFLNSSFSFQREDIIAVTAVQFENKLTSQIAGVRLEIADVRLEIAELRSEMKADFSAVQKEISGLHGQISGLHGQISGLHREISGQTRWILVAAAAIITLYPLVTRLMARLIP